MILGYGAQPRSVNIDRVEIHTFAAEFGKKNLPPIGRYDWTYGAICGRKVRHLQLVRSIRIHGVNLRASAAVTNKRDSSSVRRACEKRKHTLE
jgi:hypothetical protein